MAKLLILLFNVCRINLFSTMVIGIIRKFLLAFMNADFSSEPKVPTTNCNREDLLLHAVTKNKTSARTFHQNLALFFQRSDLINQLIN